MMKARSVAFQFLLYGWTALFGLSILPLLAGPRRWNVEVGKIWSLIVFWMLARIVGLDHQVRGQEFIPDRPVLFAFKHQSAWETVAANRLIYDPAIVLKRELSFIPFYGWFLVKTGMIAIDRARGGARHPGAHSPCRPRRRLRSCRRQPRGKDACRGSTRRPTIGRRRARLRASCRYGSKPRHPSAGIARRV